MYNELQKIGIHENFYLGMYIMNEKYKSKRYLYLYTCI